MVVCLYSDGTTGRQWYVVIPRYLWDAEHYLDANFYGRFGLWQHAGTDCSAGRKSNLYNERLAGKRIRLEPVPGATSIHLPFDQLRAKVLNVDTFPEWKKCCILMRRLPEDFLRT